MSKSSLAIGAFIIEVVLLAGGCEKSSPVSPAGGSENSPPVSPDSQITASRYVTPPPPGKLPWPQHDPQFTQAAYNAMMDSLFIINNFGQYQGGETKNSVYFHDGLDVVLWNGTKIFAVDSGYVKSIINGGEYYQTIIIGDTPGSAPGHGWSYTHVNNFQVKVGDKVKQGDYIADIHFQGVPHVHLSRVYLTSGSWSSYYDTRSIQPDNFFSYRDEQAPMIESGLRYYRNGTDSLIGKGSTAVISGNVDIVVGMREQGEYAHSKGGVVYTGFGDRLCVSRIEYEIKGPDQRTLHYVSFDFSRMVLGQFSDGVDRVYTVYKHYYTVHPGGPPNWDKIYSYYVITNTNGGEESGEVKTSDQNYSWKTNALNAEGTPAFPDGVYTVTVLAYDVAGNVGTLSEPVKVANGTGAASSAQYAVRSRSELADSAF